MIYLAEVLNSVACGTREPDELDVCVLIESEPQPSLLIVSTTTRGRFERNIDLKGLRGRSKGAVEIDFRNVRHWRERGYQSLVHSFGCWR